MLSETERQTAAQMLRTAELTREPVKQLSATWPGITFEDAYAIQNLVQQKKSPRDASSSGIRSD